MSEELCEEGIIPSGAFDFALDGAFVVIGFDDVEGELAQEGEVLGAVADAVSGGVLAHGDIKHPVEIVFDAPMCAHYCGQPLGVQAGGEDVIAGVNRLVAIGGLAHRLDAGDGADIGEAMALFQFGSRNDPGAAV